MTPEARPPVHTSSLYRGNYSSAAAEWCRAAHSTGASLAVLPAPVAPAPTAGSPRRSPPRGPGRDPLHHPGRSYRLTPKVGQARACAVRTAARSAITGSRWRARAATEAILGGPGRRVPVPVALPRPGHVHDAPRGFSEQRPQGSHAHKAAPRPRRPLPVRVPLPAAPPPASLLSSLPRHTDGPLEQRPGPRDSQEYVYSLKIVA